MSHTLYIIGNGFDLKHELRTKYQHFAFYLQENHLELYHLLLKYYGLPHLDPDDKDSERDPLWGDFENMLAQLDFEGVLNDNTDYLPDFGSDDFKSRDYHTFQFQMEIIVDKLTKDLYHAFKDFVLAVEFPKPAKVTLLELEGNAVFLNFNYTDTLENYYGVNRKRILYIHGRARTQTDPTILGHGIDPKQFEEHKVSPPEGLSPEDLDRWVEEMSDQYDYSFESGKIELRSYFSASYKSTGEIIKTNEAFFSELKDVQKVIVLGHSISEVDQPYFLKIIKSVTKKDVNWIVSCYNDAERGPKLGKLRNLGLQEHQVKLISMDKLKPKVQTLF